MPDWLQDALASGDPIPPASVIAARAALAVVLGFLVAGVYRLTLGRLADPGTLPTTLVLLAVLIALVTMVIGNSVARAFGLVGALSIVRFRTVVEDTRDTAFVIFAVVVGMAAGAGYGVLAAVGIPAVAAAALVMTWLGSGRAPAGQSVTLAVRVGLGRDPAGLLGPVFAKHLADVRLTETATGRQGVALDVTYAARLRDPNGAVALVNELNRVEGVQSVELRAAP